MTLPTHPSHPRITIAPKTSLHHNCKTPKTSSLTGGTKHSLGIQPLNSRLTASSFKSSSRNYPPLQPSYCLSFLHKWAGSVRKKATEQIYANKITREVQRGKHQPSKRQPREEQGCACLLDLDPLQWEVFTKTHIPRVIPCKLCINHQELLEKIYEHRFCSCIRRLRLRGWLIHYRLAITLFSSLSRVPSRPSQPRWRHRDLDKWHCKYY